MNKVVSFYFCRFCEFTTFVLFYPSFESNDLLMRMKKLWKSLSLKIGAFEGKLCPVIDNGSLNKICGFNGEDYLIK
jgi:hypothetical protein